MFISTIFKSSFLYYKIRRPEKTKQYHLKHAEFYTYSIQFLMENSY